MTSAASRIDVLWVPACIVIGAVVRLFRLGRQNLWIDELISLQTASWAKGAEFARGLLSDIHGPFTSLLLHVWARWGQSEAWLRLLYVIPAILTIPLAARLGRALAGEACGRWTCAVLALSPLHVWYSQEVRNYSWAIFLGTAALVAFVEAWDDRATAKTWLTLAGCLALGILTNFSVALLIAALSVAVLLRRPFSPRFVLLWGAVLAAVLLLFVPWLVNWYGRIGGERMFVPGLPPTGMPLREAAGFSWAGIPYTLWTFGFGYSLGPPLHELHLDRSWRTLAPHLPVIAAGFLVLASGLFLGLRAMASRGRLVLVGVLLAVPFVLVALMSMREVKTFHPRYLLASSFPAFVAVLGAGWSQPGAFSRGSAAVAAVLALVALGNLAFDPRYAKEDLRAAARIVIREEKPGDAVVVIYSYRPFEHYFEREGGQARLLRLHKRFLRTSDDLEAHAAEAASGGGRVWVVLARWWDVAPEEKIRAAFEKTLREERRWETPGVKITLYEGSAS